ncbi:Rossmann-like and DUF2520 domain-containing protein [Piscirickettsia litoralis]|uniref:Glycerol-3-phosphate dehydrogenase n=1 Tax=Piscirickettsia litoralis TaxID=1891921 RepID=A0ABX3A4C2_9GAMM|nr:Rossmann-like and DUF2520 domain-containing protein [Piscirickettsia litoralis]ODN43693.1 glycerol-3-phosphate dehydrogenase [Piscirickettsia litoralis]
MNRQEKTTQALPTVNIIGAGRVGQTLARLLHGKKLAVIQDIYCRTKEHARTAYQFIGSGRPVTNINQIQSADIYFLTVPDSCIKTVCEELAQNQEINFENTIVLHCSGALSAEETLASARLRGASIASAHPVLSFSSPAQAILNYQGSFCGIEGSKSATEILTPLFNLLGAVTFEISSENKSVYHAACVLSNNYAYALSHLAIQAFEQAGLKKDFAEQASLQMMQSALNNLQTLPPKQALTGPIARADHSTINKHQQALAKTENQEMAELYQKLGEYCVKYLTDHAESAKANLIDNLKSKL